jgi:tyrosinase
MRTGSGPVVSKELNMQTPPDRKKSRPPVPEMVGATSAPFEIGARTTEISLEIHPPTGPAQAPGDSAPRQITLRVENITGDQLAPTFSVYLNVPPGEEPVKHPELSAGSLGLFGLTGASHPDSKHGGSGLSFNLNISEVVGHLIATKNWDPKVLRISFVPGYWDAPVPNVKVGRVSLYYL